MSQRTDGRDTRWAQHRAQRRRELVESTLRAIRAHGAAVGMDDIAAEARTSKTVIYRHFGGRTGLYLAVVEAVDQRILADLAATTADTDPDDIITLVAEMVDSYLQLVERDREIYRFVVTRPMVDGPVEHDPVSDLTGHIGAEVTAAISGYLRRRGRDDSCSRTWGHGIVGFIRAATDHWLASDSPGDRGQVVADVTALFAPAFPPAARSGSRPTNQPAEHPIDPRDLP